MPKYNYLFTKNQQIWAIVSNKNDTPYVDSERDYYGSKVTKLWKDDYRIYDEDIKTFIVEKDDFQVVPHYSRRSSWLTKNEPELAAEVQEKLLSLDFQKYLSSEHKLNFIDKNVKPISDEIAEKKSQIAARQERIESIRRGELYSATNFFIRTYHFLNFRATWNKWKLKSANRRQQKFVNKQEALVQRFNIAKDLIHEENKAYEAKNQAFFDKLDNAHKTFQQQVNPQNIQAPAPAPQPQATASSIPAPQPQATASSIPVLTPQTQEPQTPDLSINFV